MVTIPENNNKRDYRAEVTQRIIKDMQSKNEVRYYTREMGSLKDIYIEVAREFVKKGYYAKANYFVESWKGIQCVVISKNPLSEVNARLVYSEMIR